MRKNKTVSNINIPDAIDKMTDLMTAIDSRLAPIEAFIDQFLPLLRRLLDHEVAGVGFAEISGEGNPEFSAPVIEDIIVENTNASETV